MVALVLIVFEIKVFLRTDKSIMSQLLMLWSQICLLYMYFIIWCNILFFLKTDSDSI